MDGAHATLSSAALFLMHHAEGGPSPRSALPSLVRIRTLGNWLREIDRFLTVMNREAALFIGDDRDAPTLTRLRQTTRQLRLVQKLAGIGEADRGRREAIRRIAALLRNGSDGPLHARLRQDILLVHDGNDHGGRPDRDRFPALPARTIFLIGAFYRRIGDRMMSEAVERRREIDMPVTAAAMLRAAS